MTSIKTIFLVMMLSAIGVARASDCLDAGANTDLFGDGRCDDVNNIFDCGFDQGDCCPKSCVDAEFTCGENGFDCKDPNFIVDEVPECEVFGEPGGRDLFRGDWSCSDANNRKSCDYDDGDCCRSTCGRGLEDQPEKNRRARIACSKAEFDCKDPSTYDFIGCYGDGEDSRIMHFDSDSSDMTARKCFFACQGFIYFGTQNGNECYCGTEFTYLEEYGKSTSCTTKCTGDDYEECGGHWAMSAYKYIEPPLLFTPFGSGCYGDGENIHIMDSMRSDPNMTARKCAFFCKGFSYFGTKKGNECWCGNQYTNFDSYGTSSSCTTKCAGDPDKHCGGDSAMSVYNYDYSSGNI